MTDLQILATTSHLVGFILVKKDLLFLEDINIVLPYELRLCFTMAGID